MQLYSYTVMKSIGVLFIIHYSSTSPSIRYFPPSNGGKKPQAFHCCFRAMTKVLECKASWLATEHVEWKAST
jgi:hypothetical protein